MADVSKNFNLLQIGSRWHYRRRLPKDVQKACGGQAVIKYALKTGDLLEARRRRTIEDVKWDQKFTEVRLTGTSKTDFPTQPESTEVVKDLIRSHAAQELKRFVGSLEKDPPEDGETRTEMLDEQGFVLKNLKAENRYAEEWISRAWAKIEDKAAVQNLAISADSSSISFLLRALIEIGNMKSRVLQHDYSRTHIDPAFGVQASTSYTFGQMAQSYLQRYKEEATVNHRTPKAVDKVVQNVGLFQRS